jgi:hypothetical protein
MTTEHILTLLISERDKLNRAIEALGTPVKRRGRPKSSAASSAIPVAPMAAPAPVRKRKGMTAAQKKALSTKMKAAWARRKKEAKG